jgi:hypothetical protein
MLTVAAAGAVAPLARAQAPAAGDAPNCTLVRSLKICAAQAALTLNQRNSVLRADVALEITNQSRLPVKLFFPQQKASLFPDKGSPIEGRLQMTGLSECWGGGAIERCVGDRRLSLITLGPGNSMNTVATIEQAVAIENARRTASATAARLSATLGLIDGDDRPWQIPVSLPPLSLDNGLAGR